MPLAQGHLLQDRYTIQSLLGQGGMGAVYHARDNRLNVDVAVKEMVPQPGLDPRVLLQLRRQFKNEATILARLDHPNLVGVTDFFEQEGKSYLVMDLVQGQSLADRIKQQGALAEGQVLSWTFNLLDALAYCHSKGILHRDIKPQNIIINAEGQAVLVDFGLVKLWDPRDPRTQTAMQGMGTPEYAPPEQYGSDPGHTGPRSDIYSLGATLYHALTGRAPRTVTERMADPERFVTPRRLNPSISPQTEAAILRSMELPRANRFATAQDMAATLRGKAPVTAPVQPQPQPVQTGQPQPAAQAVARPRPATPRRKGTPAWVWALGGLAGIVVIGMVGVFAWLAFGNGTGAKPEPSTQIPVATRPPTAVPTRTSPTTQDQGIVPPADVGDVYVEYVLDGSNGMAAAWPGQAGSKMIAAKQALLRHWQAEGGSFNIGLRAYGHRYDATSDTTCQDVELLVPVRPAAVEALFEKMKPVQARGLDASAEAFRQTLTDFELVPGRINAIVLLTDGGDTCGGDAVQVVEAQRETGIRLPVYVIGLAVEPGLRPDLARLTETSGGLYYNAATDADLDAALADIARLLHQLEARLQS